MAATNYLASVTNNDRSFLGILLIPSKSGVLQSLFSNTYTAAFPITEYLFCHE